ncbi:MAG: hypothetical protein HWE25_05305 [Alphaproteobacteria bacterium]|nr:hypothetical protein [Alphaproteobacteria bacterium]
MSNTVISRVRLFPLLILFSAIALGIRGMELYAGFRVLGQAAIAQEESQQANNQAQNTDQQEADESAATEAASPPPVLGIRNQAEMELISQLRQRRENLEARAQQLDIQEQLLASTEKRINDKIVQLQELEVRIKQHLRLFEDAEEKQLAAIVEVYEKMKPKDAAPRFEALALQTQVDLVSKMRPAKVAALMEQMSPQKASILTTELATQVQPPKFEEIQGNN